eukprot:scaffold4940_cov163-Amphora_coffeaeformis.AAC.8
MSTAEDLKSRIGELPRQIRRQWPWQTLGRRQTSKASDVDFEDDAFSFDSANSVTSTTPAPAEDKSGFCIGSIFGLDVGGTLAKLVYFEEVKVKSNESENSGSDHTVFTRHERHSSYTAGSGSTNSVMSEVDLRSLHALAPEYRNTKTERSNSMRDLRKTHSDEFPVGKTMLPENGELLHPPATQTDSKPRAVSETATRPIPKVQSMFDFQFTIRDREEALDRFYNFAKHLDTFTRDGVRDHKLRFYSRELGGYFHFIHFVSQSLSGRELLSPWRHGFVITTNSMIDLLAALFCFCWLQETRRMKEAIDLIRRHNLQRNIRQMGATGGGAHKFASDFEDNLGIGMKREGELESLVAGMQFVLSTVVGECYTYRPPHEKKQKDIKRAKKPVGEAKANDDYGDYFGVAWADGGESSSDSLEAMAEEVKTKKSSNKVDDWWWSRKVQRDTISYSSTYPYLVVTIGTGVSILRVDGPRKHERISGSTIGGGTYWGLIRLLTSFEEFEDVIKLAERGDPSKVDMMVGDIYGGNSDALDKLGLRADLVASSFGKLVAKDDPADGLKEEDLARALLLMVTNNIGQVAYLNAELHKTERIYFVGNFLRQNRLSQRRLAFAIDYWSKGEMEALFLEHEGYFGALGAFLLSQGIPHQESHKSLRSQHSTPLPAEADPHPQRHPLRRRQTMETFSFASSD